MANTITTYINLILPIPLDKYLTYEVPIHIVSELSVGSLVLAPLGNRKLVGIVIDIHFNTPKIQCKRIIGVLNYKYKFNEISLKLMYWISDYYMCSLGQALKCMLPGKLYSKKNDNDITSISTENKFIIKDDFLSIRDDDLNIISSIQNSFLNRDVVLLNCNIKNRNSFYIKFIIEHLQQVNTKGKLLYLVPDNYYLNEALEIFKRHFSEENIITYSSERRTKDVLNKLFYNNYKILIGTRSSCLLPLKDISLIIVDNEHDESYKQKKTIPSYNARDLAIVLAKYHKAKVLLVSNTPSLESYHNAINGKYSLVNYTNKFNNVQLSCVNNNKKSIDEISPYLLTHIENTLLHGGKVVIFNLTKGYYNYTICNECQHIVLCPNCSISLTYYQLNDLFKCNYCGYIETEIFNCKKCGSTKMFSYKSGTEKIEETLSLLYPDRRVARLDKDIINNKKKYLKLTSDFKNGDIDILVGTKMVMKILNLEKVSLVAIINVDNIISIPDFRSSEKLFQIVSNSVNALFLDNKTRKFILQTYNRNQPVIDKVLVNNYKDFFNLEIKDREVFNYPPIVRLIKIVFNYSNYNKLNDIVYLAYNKLLLIDNIIVMPPQDLPLIVKGYRKRHGMEIYIKCIKKNYNDLIEVKKNIIYTIKNEKMPYHLKVTFMVDQ